MKVPLSLAERLEEFERLSKEIDQDLDGHQVPVKKDARLNPSRYGSCVDQLRKRKKRFEDVIEGSNLPENVKSYVLVCRVVCWWARAREGVLRTALNQIHCDTISWPHDEAYKSQVLKEVNRIAAEALTAWSR